MRNTGINAAGRSSMPIALASMAISRSPWLAMLP